MIDSSKLSVLNNMLYFSVYRRVKDRRIFYFGLLCIVSFTLIIPVVKVVDGKRPPSSNEKAFIGFFGILVAISLIGLILPSCTPKFQYENTPVVHYSNETGSACILENVQNIPPSTHLNRSMKASSVLEGLPLPKTSQLYVSEHKSLEEEELNSSWASGATTKNYEIQACGSAEKKIQRQPTCPLTPVKQQLESPVEATTFGDNQLSTFKWKKCNQANEREASVEEELLQAVDEMQQFPIIQDIEDNIIEVEKTQTKKPIYQNETILKKIKSNLKNVMVPLKERADKNLDAFDVKWRYNDSIQFDEQFEDEKRKDDTTKKGYDDQPCCSKTIEK